MKKFCSRGASCACACYYQISPCWAEIFEMYTLRVNTVIWLSRVCNRVSQFFFDISLWYIFGYILHNVGRLRWRTKTDFVLCVIVFIKNRKMLLINVNQWCNMYPKLYPRELSKQIDTLLCKYVSDEKYIQYIEKCPNF